MATLKTGWITKLINGVSEKIFAISHVKSVYYNYTNNITLDEVLIETEDSDQEAPEENEISPVILSKFSEYANGAGLEFSVDESGHLCVTYDDGVTE